MMFNLDLAGAEWVIVAYLADDANMIAVSTSGKSPHVVTGSLISRVPEELVLADHKLLGDLTNPDDIMQLREVKLPELLALPGTFIPRTMSIRQAGKKSNHGLNYGMGYRRFALENEMPETDAKTIHQLYSTQAYPGLSNWWKSIKNELKSNHRMLSNCFGRKVRLLQEAGSELYDAAYSFKPQSTVGDVVNRAMTAAYDDDSPAFRPMRLGAQVHDSLMLQYPVDGPLLGEWLLAMKRYLQPDLTYSGKTFRLGVDLKVGYDWGNMATIKWADDPAEVARLVRAAPVRRRLLA